MRTDLSVHLKGQWCTWRFLVGGLSAGISFQETIQVRNVRRQRTGMTLTTSSVRYFHCPFHVIGYEFPVAIATRQVRQIFMRSDK